MLIAQLTDGRFIIGIDAENVRRLKEGKPLVAKLSRISGSADVLITYGETLEHVRQELEGATGDPLPEPTPFPGEATH